MTDPHWLDDVEMRAWVGFVRTRDLIAAAVGRDSTRESNLTYVEYSVLAFLSGTPDHRCTFADLALKLEWSQSRLSHQITRMEKRGLVVREPIPDDARRTAARLTQRGAEVLTGAAGGGRGGGGGGGVGRGGERGPGGGRPEENNPKTRPSPRPNSDKHQR
ncbi:MarR family winged helix-turn-helix transcriptional regulator, partial [Nocardia brasiliensis]|uniref:MarR family winged helix-turn-helix transcriptional regulator n=1 Tax=Nocardia brasiliensis TaxID=37326 RepID=UPI00245711D5